MNLAKRVRWVAMAAAIVTVSAQIPLLAQDMPASHLAAARSAISAIKATDDFNIVLPQAAQSLKAELIQKNPDLVALINSTVDEKALELASRRVDLEQEAALAYARVFSEQELNEINAFYQSPTGKKLITDGPIVTREVIKAGTIWQRGIARDLAQMVGRQIQSAVEAQGNATVPEEGEAKQQ